MAIKITDNFQVNIKNPIDNRFVVGSQSIPGGPGSIYPTPFYAYRDDISSNMGFVYPGLRIWDFNDNLPYVWTGTTWSNENLTGASVLDSGTPGFAAGGGYRNYITKFYDTSTVLTKSLLFDDNVHVSLDITGVVNPNSSGGAGNPNLNTTVGSVPSGLHVKGRIRTNEGFVGYGGYIHSINAQNIDAGPSNTGRLQLPLIDTPGVTNPTIKYVLTSQINPVTLNKVNSWQDILNVAPLYSPTNLGSGVQLFSGTVGLNHEFFSLVSTDITITDGITTGNGTVRLQLNATSVGSTDGTPVYKGLIGTNHEFRRIKSDTLKVSVDTLDNLTIEVPQTGSTEGLYVNNSYIPTFDDWLKGVNGNISSPPYGTYFKGKGTQAQPFTDSYTYTSTTAYSNIVDTSIQNALDYYIKGPNNDPTRTAKDAYFRYYTITIQSNGASRGNTYWFSGNFSIRNLRLKLEATIISTTTGYLIDMDDLSFFYNVPTILPGNTYAEGDDIGITITKGNILEIRGTLIFTNDPNTSFKGSLSNPAWPQRPGLGFRNSGYNIPGTTFAYSKSLNISGEGSVNSYYQPATGTNITGSNQNDNVFLFNLDNNNSLMYNNDGNLAIQILCSVYSKFQGIFCCGGMSKIEFNNCEVGSSDLGTVKFGEYSRFLRIKFDFFNNPALNSKIQNFRITKRLSNGTTNTYMFSKTFVTGVNSAVNSQLSPTNVGATVTNFRTGFSTFNLGPMITAGFTGTTINIASNATSVYLDIPYSPNEGCFVDSFYGGSYNPWSAVGNINMDISERTITDPLKDPTLHPYHYQDVFLQKGGLVRFFNCKVSVSGGFRYNAFVLEPSGANYDLTTNHTKPSMIFRGCQFGGSAYNWFLKRGVGTATVDISGCTSLYYSGWNLVATPTQESWYGSNDNRWGKAVFYSGVLNTYVNYLGYDSGQFNFRNNVVESIKVDQTKVDLTISNNISALNTIGSQVVQALQQYANVGEASVYIQQNSQFINRGAMYGYQGSGGNNYNIQLSTYTLIEGKNYIVESTGDITSTAPGSTKTRWLTAGFDTDKLGQIAKGKLFTCRRSFALNGTASVIGPISVDYVP